MASDNKGREKVRKK